jgi:hypothetical protein
MVVGRSFCYYNMIGYLDSLLSQSDNGRAFWSHVLDRLHDCMELHNVEVRVLILNQSVIRRPGIGHF